LRASVFYFDFYQCLDAPPPPERPPPNDPEDERDPLLFEAPDVARRGVFFSTVCV
jgi:hypothetical protein